MCRCISVYKYIYIYVFRLCFHLQAPVCFGVLVLVAGTLEMDMFGSILQQIEMNPTKTGDESYQKLFGASELSLAVWL